MADAAYLQDDVTRLSIIESSVSVCGLRVRKLDAALARRLSKSFALPWPMTPNTVSGSSLRVAWLAPDEWAVFAAAESIREKIANACRGQLYHLTDLSAGQRLWQISGPTSAALISKGCSLDIHPAAFRTGQCARTLLAQIPVLLIAREAGPAFDILVDTSLAGHMRAWLFDAAREFESRSGHIGLGTTIQS